MPKKSPTPYDDELGCVCVRKNIISGEWAVLYDARLAGMSESDGRWKMLCSEHGAIVSERTKAQASKALRSPETWCKNCKRKAKAKTKPMKPIVVSDDKEKLEREMCLLANKVRNNPEKCEIFEKIYGVKPDQYWSR